MNIKPKDILYGLALVGMGYGLYKLYRGASYVGEKAGDIVQSATQKWLTFRYGNVEFTEAAKLSRDEYIKKGYMAKVRKPFSGCETLGPDGCYAYEITPKGKAYVEAKKKALGIQ